MTECGICFEDKATLPCKLECGHTFCYMCIKQSYFSSNKCPMCRREIKNFRVTSLKEENIKSKWMYSGNNGGWWYYDEETSSIIENNWLTYKSKKRSSFNIPIMGRTYCMLGPIIFLNGVDEAE